MDECNIFLIFVRPFKRKYVILCLDYHVSGKILVQE